MFDKKEASSIIKQEFSVAYHVIISGDVLLELVIFNVMLSDRSSCYRMWKATAAICSLLYRSQNQINRFARYPL